MKTLVLFAMALVSIAQAAPAHALVLVKENCVTSDGKYKVMITDNQGIGAPRVSHLVATITDEQGAVVGSYDVDYVNPRIHSISFGHADYLDSSTQGRVFDFALPSTNSPKSVIATLSNGETIEYGVKFDLAGKNQGGLSCGNI